MPLRPASGINFLIQIAVEEYHGGIRSPGPAKEDLACLIVDGDAAMIKNVAALLFWISLALRRNISLRMRGHMDVAMIEDSLSVAENEINIAFNVAVVKVL